jgi:predicted acylesterase/phospholipase RssA
MAHHGIALALGGGGMFGAYQAGLWAGLQPSFTPAHVFGASIGAFNGFAVSSGCDAGELVDLWLDFREAAGAKLARPLAPAFRLHRRHPASTNTSAATSTASAPFCP